MRLSIRHRTTYRFTAPQARVIQLARLTPANSAGQAILNWDLSLSADARLRPARDGYGNAITMLYVDGPLDVLTIEAAGEVLTQDQAGVVRNAPEPLPPTVFLRQTDLTQADADIRAMAETAREAGTAPLAQMHGLMRLIGARMRYDTSATDVSRSASEALQLGHGVCQDLTHIFCAAARLIDIPARYVSGHLFQRNATSEQTAAHAWAEVWIEGLGWVGYDAVNGISPDDAYVRVAVGLDYREAAPLAGARVGEGEERLDVSITVEQTGRR